MAARIFTLLSLAGSALAATSDWVSITDQLIPYNAMYNGTLTIDLKSDVKPECDKVTTIANFSMHIGPITAASNTSLTRSGFDDNPFFFYVDNDYSERGKWIYFAARSSGDEMTKNKTVASRKNWQVSSTKAGDGYDIKATFLTEGDQNAWAQDTCYIIYSGAVDNFTPPMNWSMAGHLSANAINVTFTQSPYRARGWGSTMFTRTWHFDGTWDPKTPKVDVSGPEPVITGRSQYFPLPGQKGVNGTNGTANGTSSQAGGKSGAAGAGKPAMVGWGLLAFAMFVALL